MSLPKEIRNLLTPHLVELLNQQWSEMIQRQSVIQTLQCSISDIRSNLQHDDYISTPLTPCYSGLSNESSNFSVDSHTFSVDASHDSFFGLLDEPRRPSLGYTPMRHQLAASAFNWHAPPVHWALWNNPGFMTSKTIHACENCGAYMRP